MTEAQAGFGEITGQNTEDSRANEGVSDIAQRWSSQECLLTIGFCSCCFFLFFLSITQDGMRHGKGAYFFEDGSRYEGGFREDKRHGAGTLILAGGGRYALALPKRGGGSDYRIDLTDFWGWCLVDLLDHLAHITCILSSSDRVQDFLDLHGIGYRLPKGISLSRSCV